MYLRWKHKRQGTSSKPTAICTHRDAPLESIAPLFVECARTGKNGSPRQHTIWRPAGSLRVCCLGSPLARAAWWTATEVRWDSLEEEIHGDVPNEDIEEYWREMFVDILSYQRHWFERMSEKIPRPTQEDRIYYARILRGQTLRLDPLGLQWPFTASDLKTAWRRAVLQTHPDQGGSGQAFHDAKASYEEARRLLGDQEG